MGRALLKHEAAATGEYPFREECLETPKFPSLSRRTKTRPVRAALVIPVLVTEGPAAAPRVHNNGEANFSRRCTSLGTQPKKDKAFSTTAESTMYGLSDDHRSNAINTNHRYGDTARTSTNRLLHGKRWKSYAKTIDK